MTYAMGFLIISNIVRSVNPMEALIRKEVNVAVRQIRAEKITNTIRRPCNDNGRKGILRNIPLSCNAA